MGRKSRITIVSIRSDGVCFYFVYSSLFDEKQGLLEGSSVFFMMVCESGFYLYRLGVKTIPNWIQVHVIVGLSFV